MSEKIKVRPILLSALVVGGLLASIWWHRTHHGGSPESILGRSDLAESRFDYSWAGGFSLGNSDVRASFTGDGYATLQIGDGEPLRVQVGQERYRELLQTLATNRFDEIRVRRRWGVYLHDIGRYELVLHDGARRTVIYADEKHYVAQPELLEPILEKVYSFKDDFGTRLDHGPLGMAGTRDTREIMLIISAVAGCVTIGIAAALYMQKRKRRNAELGGSPDRGPGRGSGNSAASVGPPSVS